MRRVRWFLAVCAILAVAALLLARTGIDAARLPREPDSVTYEDRTGLPLGTIDASPGSGSAYVPLKAVAPAFLAAIVDTEDARFYRHQGFDLAALARAGREYVVLGTSRSGGSTIDMQLARMIDPTLSASLKGKLRQIVAAQRLDFGSSKAAILEAYVNRLPMGGNVYGIESASRQYFGESAAELDLAQAALLAAIPNDPARLNPYAHWDGLRERQRYVLDRMVACGDASRTQADVAFAEALHVRPQQTSAMDAPHALYHLFAARSPGQTRVRTTIDRDLERFVTAQMRNVLGAVGDHHVTDGAALVVDNRTGDVLAYVGSPDYFSADELGGNDGVQMLRQPGSSLKPFTYEIALERGTIRTTTILPDVPTTFALPGAKVYEPSDYSGSFLGPVLPRIALANSLNVPAVRVLSMTGVDTLLERLHRLGFTHLNKPARYYGLGLTLGGGEVSLWELTHAYSIASRRGVDIPLRLLPAPQASAAPIGDPKTWSFITNVLADPYARAKEFGVRSVLRMPFDAAVKTGTSSDFRDTWTVGYTRDYTVGVWVGNFDGTAMQGVSGVTGAGPLWNRIMLHLHERREPEPFDKPDGYAQTRVCATTGYAPLPSCKDVVLEYVKARDLADIQTARSPKLDRTYDAWLAQQPPDQHGAIRIVSPQAGAIFYYRVPQSQLEAQEQQISLRATGDPATMHWSIDGAPLASDADGHAFWPLRIGRHTVTLSADGHTQTASFTVVPMPPSAHQGFSRTP